MHPDETINLTHDELLYMLKALKGQIERLESNTGHPAPHDEELGRLLEREVA